jgi:hypothetical protein
VTRLHRGRYTPPKQRGPRLVDARYLTDRRDVARLAARCLCPIIVDTRDPELAVIRHLHRHACPVLVEARRGGR